MGGPPGGPSGGPPGRSASAVRLCARQNRRSRDGRLLAQGLEVESDFLDGSADHLNLAQIAGSDAELFGQPEFVVAPRKTASYPFAPWDRSSWRP